MAQDSLQGYILPLAIPRRPNCSNDLPEPSSTQQLFKVILFLLLERWRLRQEVIPELGLDAHDDTSLPQCLRSTAGDRCRYGDERRSRMLGVFGERRSVRWGCWSSLATHEVLAFFLHALYRSLRSSWAVLYMISVQIGCGCYIRPPLPRGFYGDMLQVRL